MSRLRQPYERMIGKVESMLGRESLWRVLSDPNKFHGQLSAK